MARQIENSLADIRGEEWTQWVLQRQAYIERRYDGETPDLKLLASSMYTDRVVRIMNVDRCRVLDAWAKVVNDTTTVHCIDALLIRHAGDPPAKGDAMSFDDAMEVMKRTHRTMVDSTKTYYRMISFGDEGECVFWYDPMELRWMRLDAAGEGAVKNKKFFMTETVGDAE